MMEKILAYYLEDNGKNLKKLSDVILMRHFGWMPQKDYDDFYSIAGEVLWHTCKSFNTAKGAQFETYLIGCLTRKFKTRVTYMNRQRRNNGNQDISLDSLIDDNDTCLLDLIVSDDRIEIEVYSDKMNAYLNRLSTLQKKVLFLLADGYSNDEIKHRLNMSSKELTDAINTLRAYRNVSLLY